MPSAEPMSMTLGASTFERNLAVLSRGSPDAAARVRLSPPRPDARVIATDDGVPAIELVQGASAVALCSRRRPLDEARRLIEPVDIADAAIFVVLGFGAGYHVAELARKVGRSGLIVVWLKAVRGRFLSSSLPPAAISAILIIFLVWRGLPDTRCMGLLV